MANYHKRKRKVEKFKKKRIPKQKYFEVTIILYNDIRVVRVISANDKETAVARLAVQVGKMANSISSAKAVSCKEPKESEDEDFE